MGKSKLDGMQQSFQDTINSKADFSSFSKELAYMNLMKDPSSIMPDTKTFGDNFSKRFGMVLDEVNSTNVTIKDGGLIMAESTQTTQTVTDATVIPNAYDTSGNGGRKLVMDIDKNLYVIAVDDDGANNTYTRVYKSVDNGSTWEEIVSSGSNAKYSSIECIGDNLYVLQRYSGGLARVRWYNTDGVYQDDFTFPAENEIAQTTLTRNAEGTELHAAWSSKNSTYPNSFNIRYAKGTVNGDGSVTWGSVEQVTAVNNSQVSYRQPSIVLNGNNKPVIIGTYDGNPNIIAFIKGTSWTPKSVFYLDGYTQSSPSAIFVPQSVNGLANGRIWVAWHGTDSTDSNADNIRISYSDDGGSTWSTMQKLTSGDTYYQWYASITANKDGEVFVVFHGATTTQSYSDYRIKYIKHSSGSWGNVVEVNGLTNRRYANTLFDTTFSLSYSVPLTVYEHKGTEVEFFGTWQTQSETPTATATAIYTLDDAQSLGAFVQREGVVDVEAYLNDELMDVELDADEYQFTHELSSEAPLDLRLELSRVDTTNGDADRLTRVLGGRA